MTKRGILAGVLATLALSPAAAQDFTTPSGNITCHFDAPLSAEAGLGPEYREYALRCDMIEGTPFGSEPPEGCNLDWGKSLSLSETGPALRTCHGDTILNPDAPALDYGRAIGVPGISCRSERTGVTCTNRDGRGFFISRLRQRVF